MKVYGIDLSVIIIAIITAFIGFQFNNRTKKKEQFLKELKVSYDEVYSPMYEELQLINGSDNKENKIVQINNFFERYGGIDTKIRYIGSSFLLEYFYDFREVHKLYCKEASRKNEKELMDRLKGFQIMIEDEFWKAHDIIYEDHIYFQQVVFLNPFLIACVELLRLLYHFSTFTVWISLLVLYFTIWNHFSHIEPIPEWWGMTYAVLLLGSAVMLFGLTLSYKEIVAKKNKRKNQIVKKMFKKFRR